jgi:hypothetical protein
LRAQTNYTVVRNECFSKAGVGVRERHNERKNGDYANTAIDPSRSHLNHTYVRCDGTYEQTLNRLLEEKIISDKGLKKDTAKYFGELVFDVNTLYFDERGGYDYAKRFYGEAFRYAERKVGAEYILSAVMHADEIHQGELADTGERKYHYHLHVVYIPVVEKEVRYSMRNKNPELRGKVKETIHQNSASKKWAFQEAVGTDGQPLKNRNGKAVRIPSYSILQDEFYEHMTAAGFDGFERGERGSNARHLTVTEYKTEKERERLSFLSQQVDEKTEELDGLVESFNEMTGLIEYDNSLMHYGRVNEATGLVEIGYGKYEKLVHLATISLNSRATIKRLTAEVDRLTKRVHDLTDLLKTLFEETKWYRTAERLAPAKVKGFISKVLRADRDKGHRILDREEYRFKEDLRTIGRANAAPEQERSERER